MVNRMTTFQPLRRPARPPQKVGRRGAARWRRAVIAWWLLLASAGVDAQVPPQLPAGGAALVMTPQTPVDLPVPVTVSAAFDPPTVRPGEKTFYRVTVDSATASVQWPEQISAPTELKFGPAAHGQIARAQNNQLHLLSSLVCAVRPTGAGRFTVSNGTVNVAGRMVNIPAASLEMGTNAPFRPPARQLWLETSATNLFQGQSFRVRVWLPARMGNQIEALRELQFNGGGLITDKTTLRQTGETLTVDGQPRTALLCEIMATPMATGPLTFSAQGFSAGSEFIGPVIFRGPVSFPGGPANYVLHVSDPMTLNVRPLPAAGELPGFTGAIGSFSNPPPQLAAHRLRVGEPVHLQLAFYGEDGQPRHLALVPPTTRDWQMIADQPPGNGFTLIPQTDESKATPAIPFCYFDPTKAKYVDLSIPALPVTVLGESLPVQLATTDAETPTAPPLKLSGLAPTPGHSMASLTPLQLQGWFVGVQLLPVAGFLALWQWDRRRRFLEAHPELVRRRQARRALRREWPKLRRAIAAADTPAFVQHAVTAMKIAVAPQYPANPQALVCADVLAQLAGAEPGDSTAEAVRKLFAAADAQFSKSAPAPAGLLELQADLTAALLKLEEKL